MPGSDEPNEEIPAFKISAKKVDDSWKEEARKEREAAARAVAGQRPVAPASAPKPEASAPPAASAGSAAAAASAKPTQKGGAPEAGPEQAAAKPQSPLEQQQSKIFLGFIDGLAQQALMQLGELENPYTGQAEMDLQGARQTIELLAVILAKTKGNVTDVEHQAMTGVIQDLRTHFQAIAQEMQRQMALQAAQRGAMRPGPGGTVR